MPNIQKPPDTEIWAADDREVRDENNLLVMTATCDYDANLAALGTEALSCLLRLAYRIEMEMPEAALAMRNWEEWKQVHDICVATEDMEKEGED